MKRKFLAFLLAFVMIVGMLPMTALAAGGDTGTLQALIDAEGTDPINITVSDEKTESITIPSGKTVNLTIEENGKLTNEEGKDTITVEGTLTIKGTGTVTSTGHASFGTIFNKPGGTVTIEGGTISKGKNASGRSWYVIKNLGTMTISGGSVKYDVADQTTENVSSLIDNGWGGSDRGVAAPADETKATLEITNGAFDGGLNTVKNDSYAELTISNGSLTNTKRYAVQNWGKTTIRGGNFDCSQASTGVIQNLKNPNDAGSIGELRISGGDYKAAADKPIIGTNSDYPATITEISGGTFNIKPNADFIAEGKEAAEDADGNWVVGNPAPATLTFDEIETDPEILGKKVSDLGSFTVAADETNDKTIKVTGSANYVTEYTQFNTAVADEQTGHYVALKIAKPAGSVTVVLGEGDKAKNLGFTDETNTCEYLVLRCDDTKEFKVTATKNGTPTEYKIDLNGVVQLPKPVVDETTGTTTESKVEDAVGSKPAQVVTETKDDQNKLVGSVKLPANIQNDDEKGLGSMAIEVKPVENTALPSTVKAGEKVTAALKAETTTLVEVTVKVINADGSEGEEQFTSNLSKADITITIGGLTAESTYHVFSIDSEGNVTSYGYKTLGAGESKIELNSKHLTIFAAALVDTTESGTGLKASDVQGDDNVDKTDETSSGLTQSDGTPPTPPASDITATWSTSIAPLTGAGDGKVTISGTGITDGTGYILKVTVGGANVYLNVKATTGNKVEFVCQGSAKLELMNSTNAATIWTSGSKTANQLDAG